MKEDLKYYKMSEDIAVHCSVAKSFPDGVMESHVRLHSLFPDYRDRRYFGISYPDKNGNINYKSAVEKLNTDNVVYNDIEQFEIKSGMYIGVHIKDFMSNPNAIGEVFNELITYPNIDPIGYCLEQYINISDVICMVKVIE